MARSKRDCKEIKELSEDFNKCMDWVKAQEGELVRAGNRTVFLSKQLDSIEEDIEEMRKLLREEFGYTDE